MSTQQTATASHDWYTIARFGWHGNQRTSIPSGPWHGRQAAEAALDRWAQREGATAGSTIAACAVSVVGPFCTRSDAQQADVTDWPQRTCRDAR